MLKSLVIKGLDTTQKKRTFHHGNSKDAAYLIKANNKKVQRIRDKGARKYER